MSEVGSALLLPALKEKDEEMVVSRGYWQPTVLE